MDIRPIMSQEEYEAMEPGIIKSMLICNMPGCGNVVCTMRMLCVDHWISTYRSDDNDSCSLI
jgi:hypothetical protein